MSGYEDQRAQPIPVRRRLPSAEPQQQATQAMPVRSGGPGGPGRQPVAEPAPTPRRKRRWRRVVLAIGLIITLWLTLLAWAGFSAWGAVDKIAAFPTGDRPAAGSGTNVLLVGSDSRAGLSSEEAHDLGTGGSNVSEGSAHTDSIMLLHLPSSGQPTLVSFPRDSYVPIPGHGRNKINASFAFGGAPLLVETIEDATGLRIDGYMEIGFGGFAGVVNAVGGVRMCLPEAVKDDYAHIDLPAGCQKLNGKDALGYVRSRHAFAEGDLARAKHQREFLAALMSKIASPVNVLMPWKLRSIGVSGAQGLAVDNEMSPWMAFKTVWALKGISSNGTSVQVPIAGNASTNVGDVLLWDKPKALALFEALRNDTALPTSISP